MSVLSILIFIFIFQSAFLADHNTFKNCSRVEFCNTLRTKSPEDKYKSDVSSLTVDSDNAQVTLKLLPNDDSTNLLLTIIALENSSFRIQIKEEDSERYELQDILIEDPKKIDSISVDQSDDSVDIPVGNYIARIVFNPFDIHFLVEDQSVLTFKGNRLNFDQSLNQVYTFGLDFPEAEQLYGIHEHADDLALRSTQDGSIDPYRLRNLDVSEYELDSPMALYGSIPVLYGHGVNITTGVFLHNAAEQWYDLNNGENTNVYILVESGALDLFVFLGPRPIEIVRQYVALTGTAHLPQLWALGYHQCRWNYVSQDDIKEVVANFTTYNFPLDTIWLDIEYADGRRYFTWNPDKFSDPVEMQQNISATHKRLITIIDPHIKVEEGYDVYDGALEKDLFIKNPNGTIFEGDCWPGLSSYMDFLNPEALEYYGDLYSYDNFPSSTPVLAGIWNDMNEPTVFDTSLEKTLSGEAVHYGDVIHRDVHNIYGFLHSKSTHEGLLRRDNSTKRPFVLTRSHFAGSQRYAAIWTGDNAADWPFISASYLTCLNANILGIVFCGSDVGGFYNDPTPELLQRFYQAEAWLPFYRAHATADTQRREPYLFDEDVQEVIRYTMQLRYKHIPMWYTLFYEHTRTGDPIVRPLFYHYPSDNNVYKLKDHLLAGSDILVRAVTESEVDSVEVYFPGGKEEYWFSINDKQVYLGNGFVNVSVDIQAIPVFYRKGSVIARKETERLSTDETADDGYTLYLNLDSESKATGTVYLDDFASFNYANNKQYNYFRVDVHESNVTFTKIDDDADSDAFEFKLDGVIVNQVEENPTKEMSGRYKTVKYTKTQSGELFTNMKLEFDKTFTMKLGK